MVPSATSSRSSAMSIVALLPDDVVGGLRLARALPVLEERERPVLRDLALGVLVPGVHARRAPRHPAVRLVDRGVVVVVDLLLRLERMTVAGNQHPDALDDEVRLAFREVD